MNVKVFVPLAFVIGLGGGTAGVVLTRPPVVAADSLHAKGDSLHAEGDSTTAKGDSSHAPTDGTAAPHDSGAKAATGDTAHAAPATPVAGAPSAGTPVAAKKDSVAFDAARIAKAVGGLDAADAALMLQPMGDDQVSAVLRELGVRRSGPILKAFPTARAERLGRGVLAGMEKHTP